MEKGNNTLGLNLSRNGRLLLLFILLIMFFAPSKLQAQNYAVAFDGTGDFISIPNHADWNFGTNDFTIAFWVSFANLNKVNNGLFGRDNYQWVAMEYNHDGDKRLNVWIDSNGSAGWNLNNFKSQKNDWIVDTWYHIALVREGNQIRLFIDGTVDNSTTYTQTVFNPTVPLYFGRSQLSNRFHQGLLDDIRIFNKALNSAELEAQIFTELAGNELDLLAYWNLNVSVGTSTTDASPNAMIATLNGDAVWVNSDSPVLPGNSTIAPFSPVDPTGLPYTMVITSVSIDGQSLPANSSIGLFSGNLCVGASNYNSVGNTQIVAWRGDAAQGLAGFTNGDSILVKVRTEWFSEIVVFLPITNFVQGNGTFGFGSFSVASLNINSGLTPSVLVSTNLLNFNALPVNETLTLPIIISNTGTAILTIPSINSSNAVFTFSPASMQIAPGTQDTLFVTFTPNSVSAFSASLAILTDHPDFPSIPIALHGSGLPLPSPVLQTNPGYLTFGSLQLGDTASLSFSIINTGNGSLQVNQIISNNAAFIPGIATPFSLSQNQSQEVDVLFIPSAGNFFSGSITITSNAGNITIPISGNGGSGYFQSVQPTGLPYSIIIEDVLIDDQFNLSIGDEIAVFDDTLCVGIGSLNFGGMAASFDGGANYFYSPIDVSEYNYTVEFWFKSNSNNGGLFAVTGGGHDRHIYLHNGNIYTRIYNNETINTTGLSLGDGNWHHLAHVFGGSEGGQKIYVDGVLRAQGSKAFSDFSWQTGVHIGYSEDKGYLNGQMDELRIWSIARSQSEIQQTMNQTFYFLPTGLQAYFKFDGNAQDFGPNSYSVTQYGSPGYLPSQAVESSATIITVWEENPMQNQLGFQSGNNMSFKLKCTLFNTELELEPIPSYSFGNSEFGYNPFTVVSLEATSGIAPEVTFSTQNLYVGQIPLNESIIDSFYIYNNGNAPVQIGLEITSAQFSLVSSNALLPANDSMAVAISFAPNQIGNHVSSIQITTNDPNVPLTVIELQGFALPTGITNLNLTPQLLNFNGVAIGNQKSMAFHIINNGTAPLQVTNITSNRPEFSVSQTGFTLNNTNDNQEIFLIYTPVSKGVVYGSLTIQSNAGNFYLHFSGVGSDGYFTSVSPSGLPYNLIIKDHNLTGLFEHGDEIGLFADSLCIGSATILPSGSSLLLDGSGDYFEVPHSSSISFNGSQLSFQAWIKLESYSSSRMILNKESSYEFQISSNGRFQVAIETTAAGVWAWTNGNAQIPLNTWTHVAATYNGAHIKTYVNGELDEQSVLTGSIEPSNSNLGIGARGLPNSPSAFFQGQIDEVALFDGVKTQAEIQSSMQLAYQGNENNLKGYWKFNNSLSDFSSYNNSGILRGDAQLTGSEPELLAASSIQVTVWEADPALGFPGFNTGDSIVVKAWVSLNEFAQELDGEPIIIHGDGTYGYGMFTVMDVHFLLGELNASPQEFFVALDEPDSIVQYLNVQNLGEGNLYFQLFPDEFTHTHSLHLDGNGDYVNLGAWNTGSQWTLQAWVKPTSVPSGRKGIIGGIGSCLDWGINLHNGFYGVAIKPPGVCSGNINSTIQAIAGEWTHVAATNDGNTVKLYINGNLAASGAVEPNYAGLSNSIRIGGEHCCSSNNFPGLIDEVQVWNYPLSDSSIRANMYRHLQGNETGLSGYWNFNDGTVNDLSINERHGTLFGDAHLSAPSAPCLPSWIDFETQTQELSPGQSINLPIHFNSTGLIDGMYQNTIFLNSSEAYSPISIIPVSMNVTGNPQISVSFNQFDFGEIIVGNSSNANLIIQNIGTDVLQIDSLFFGDGINSGLSLLGNINLPIQIAPLNSYSISLSFQAMNEGAVFDTLFIFSNASNDSSLLIPVMGIGLTPAEISLSAYSWTGSINSGDFISDTIYLYNQGQADLVFNIGHNIPWLSIDPSEGVIGINDSLALVLSISGINVFAGEYSGSVQIQSNDLTQPIVYFDLDLSVFGEPAIGGLLAINFGIINVGDVGAYSYHIQNTGSDTLVVDSLLLSNYVFSYAGPGGFAIAPGMHYELVLLFSPELAFNYAGILSIHSNAVNESIYTVVLQAQGNLPPKLALNFDSISVNVPYGNLAQVTGLISNIGGEPLNYTLYLEQASGKELQLDGDGDYINILNNPTLNPDTAMTIEAWIYLQDNNLEFIVAKEYSAVGTYRLYIDELGKLKFQLNTNRQVSSLSAIPLNQWVHVAASTNGKIMQVFVDGELAGEIEYPSFTIHSNAFNLRIGRSYLNQYFKGKMDELRIWGVYKNESEIKALMNQTIPNFDEELLLYYSFNEHAGNIVHDATMHSNNGTLYGNASRVAGTLNLNDFLTLSPATGVIAGGNDQSIDFEFLSESFIAGQYARTLVVQSNDLDNPEIKIPINLQISGAGDLEFIPYQLSFASTYIGQIDTIEFRLINHGASTINLDEWIFSDSQFTADFKYKQVWPLSEKIIHVLFTPSVSGSYTEDLSIPNNSPNLANLSVPIYAQALQPPKIVLSQNVFHQNSDWGQMASQILSIYNEGDGDLNWTATGNNPDWLSLSSNSGLVSPGDSVEVFLIFNSDNEEGNYSSLLQIVSNDFINPNLSVSVSLSIAGPEASVSQSTLNNWVTFQETTTDTVYLYNSGVGPLDFAINTHANWLSVLPADGTVAVGDSLELILTYNGNFTHGNYQTMLEIETNDFENQSLFIDVSLDILFATLVSIPGNLNFGYAVVNIGKTLSITVLNNGNVPLTIDSIYSVAPFTPESFYNTYLAPGASVTVPVFFLPNATLFYNEAISIVTDIGNFTVPVSGTGQNPQAAWHYSWSMWDFGLTDAATGATKTLYITNTGNIPWVMDDWDISSEYFTVSDTIFSLNPGQTKAISIGFYPDAVAIYEGTLLWTTNAIGTKEILLDGRGFFLSDAPVLTYVSATNFSGNHGVYPRIGSSSTYFEYRVIYTDADNHAPMESYPRVGIDKNGDGDFLDSGESEFEMFEVDVNDTIFSDGKEYIFTTLLPLDFDLGYSFMAFDELGNPGIGQGTNYRSDPFVSNDFLDLSIYANDIQFSDGTPEVGQVIQISATIHNNSDYPSENISVRFYEEDEFLTELFVSYLGGQSQVTLSINHFFTADGYYPIKVVIDEENFIIEDNELNNFAIRPVLVGEFSVPGAIEAIAFVNPSSVQPYGLLHWYGHADYVGSYDPNSNVSGAQVTMTILETGYTTTTYTNVNGDFSIYFNAPATPGYYTIAGEITDFTLTGQSNNVVFQVFIPSNPIMGPDLAITYWWGTDIHWTPECRKIGDLIDVTAIVTNIGNMTAYDALVHVFQDNNMILNPIYDSIPAGTNKVIQFQVVYYTVGTHSVSVNIDPYNTIDELQEWNNNGSRSRWIFPLEPDLKPVYAWVNNSQPLQGQPVNVSFKIDNLECTTSDSTTADFYHIFEGDTTYLTSQIVDPICATCYDYLYLYNFFSQDVGYHTIMLVVDPDNVITETQEENNRLSITFYVKEAVPDLRISDISFSAYNPDLGDLMNFTATVWNNGTSAADSFYVRFYVDGVQLGDSILISHLPNGVNTLVTSAPWTFIECGHIVSATVDEEDIIVETNEYNNQTSRPLGYDFVPSLWPFYYSNHINVLVGTPVTLRSRIHNYGTLDADTVFVSYVMNNSMIAYDGIPFIHHQSHANSSHIYTFQYTGTYAVYIYADRIWPDSTRYCEINENNNVTVLYVTVYGEDPDLEVLSHYISPTELNPDPGESIDIFGSFWNRGNVPAGPFYIKFYANSVQLGDSIYVPGLAANEDSTVACTESFVSSLIGTHIIRMELDVTNVVVETNELNNGASRAIIVGDAPDHSLIANGAGIWLSDTIPDIGETITINGVIKNNGGASGSALISYYYIFLGDTIPISSTTYTIAPGEWLTVPINWLVTVPYGKIYANITNANPEEFNIFNNSTSIDFGTQLPALSGSISASANLICNGETVTISLAPSGGLGSYISSWSSSPAGFLSTSTEINVSPTTTTTYYCVIEDGIQEITVSTTVQVISASVDLGEDIAICGNEVHSLSAGTFDSYLWSTGETVQSIQISESGVYWLSVTEGPIACAATDTLQINFYPVPDSEFHSYLLCETSEFVHTPNRLGNFFYQWSNGAQTESVLISEPGWYYATVSDGYGCFTIDSVELVVSLISLDLGDEIPLCPNNEFTLNVGNFANYEWSTGATTAYLTISQAGSYSLTVSNQNGCIKTDSVVVFDAPVPEIILIDELTICEGQQTSLTANHHYSYQWSTGASSQSISINQGGVYYLTVSNEFGCQAGDSTEVLVQIPAQISFIGLDTDYCVNDASAYLVAAPQGGYFTGSGVLGETFNPSWVNPGLYSVSYHYLDTNDCYSSFTLETTVHGLPTLSIQGLESEYFVESNPTGISGSPIGGSFSGPGIDGFTFNPYTAGPGTHTIYYTFTDQYGCSNSDSAITIVSTVYTIYGSLNYANMNGQALGDVNVYCWQNAQSIDTSLTSSAGSFLFTNRPNGMYHFSFETELPTGGINATDALKILRHVVYLETLNGIALQAADVNSSGTISSADALLVLRHTVGYIETFPAGDWVFQAPAAQVLNDDFYLQAFGLAYGDVNESYQLSQSKMQGNKSISLDYKNHIQSAPGEIIDLPLSFSQSIDFGAMTLTLNYPTEKFEILGVESEFQFYDYRLEKNSLRIAIADGPGRILSEGEPVCKLKLRLLSESDLNRLFTINTDVELVSPEGKILDGVNLILPDFINYESRDFILYQNFPNPFKENSNWSFYLSEPSEVRVRIINKLGISLGETNLGHLKQGYHQIPFNANSLSSGVYHYQFFITTDNSTTHANGLMQIIK